MDFTELLDTPFPITEAQIARFRDEGYIKLKNVLPPAVLSHFATVISQAVTAKNPLAGKTMAERSTYERAFVQITNLWQTCPPVRPLVFSKRLAQLAATLMGVNGVRLYHDQALYKEPGGGFTPWHADQYYWPLSTTNTCTVWIPLQATPLAMGPLAFSRKSHQFHEGRDLAISDASEATIGPQLEKNGFPLETEPFDLGEVSFHYGWTFHRAGPNQTTAPRRVMTMIYMEDGIRLTAPQRPEHEADRAAFIPDTAVGDVAASAYNPLLFP